MVKDGAAPKPTPEIAVNITRDYESAWTRGCAVFQTMVTRDDFSPIWFLTVVRGVKAIPKEKRHAENYCGEQVLQRETPTTVAR